MDNIDLKNFTWRAALIYIMDIGQYPSDNEFINGILRYKQFRITPEAALRLAAYFTNLESSRQIKNLDPYGFDLIDPDIIIKLEPSYGSKGLGILVPSNPMFWLYLQHLEDIEQCQNNLTISGKSLRIINGANFQYDNPLYIDLVPIYKPAFNTFIYDYVSNSNIKLTTDCVSSGRQYITDDYGNAHPINIIKLMFNEGIEE